MRTHSRFTLPLLALLLVLGAAPTAAQAAPSVESLKYVTIYQPPGGGQEIRRETAGPNNGNGLTRINIDSDPDDELTANVGFSFDATELAVTGQLQIARLDFTGPLIPGTLPPLPVRIEAVAVLKDTVNGQTTRQNVSVGYDARTSSAPGRFTLDLGSCSTPNCRTTPTTCTAPCKGTKTTLGVNVVAPSNSMKLIGELSGYGSGGSRVDPTRAEIDFSPVPGNSSPVVFTIWGTETPASGGGNPATLTHVSMDGNKDALKATARICRLPGETYTPQQIGHTACDAAGYDAQRFDSRIVDATLDSLPRDVASGKSQVSVSVANNGRGRAGGEQTIEYSSIRSIQAIDVRDRSVTWDGAKKHEGERTYELRGVPTSMKLTLRDEAELEGVKQRQIATYDADARLTSANVRSVERTDGAMTNQETLLLQDVPTHARVVAEESETYRVLPGIFDDGFERKTRQTLGLTEASGRIGLIEYTAAPGETSIQPPAGIGNAYVYAKKPETGVPFTKVRLPGAERGELKLHRFEELRPHNNPFFRPKKDSGLELLSVEGKLSPTPFRVIAEDEGRVFDVKVEDVPDEVDLELRPQEGAIDYTGSATIGRIAVHAEDPDGLFKRAHTLDVLLEGVPTGVNVRYPHDGNEDIELDVSGGEIGKLEITALNENDSVPGDIIGPEDDGVILRDIQDVEDVDDEYVIFARVRGLRKVAVKEFDQDRDTNRQMVTTTKQFALDSTARRIFVVDSQKTGQLYGPSSRDGSGWDDDNEDCEMHPAGKVVEKQRAVIENLSPGTELNYDKRHAYGQRLCYEHVNYNPGGPGPPRGTFTHTKDIRYSADTAAGRMDFLTEDARAGQYVRLDSLPTRLRFCRSIGHDCLPDIGDNYGTSEGSLVFDASDYVNINMVDCEEHFEDGSCGSANARVTDLHIKKVEFWGDQDADGISGDLYLNTADWESGENQPFRGGRIKTDSIDFKFGDGFYARGAHIYWDNIWDDETGDWGPPGAGGGIVYCPSGTDWQIKAVGSWWDTTEDWCNRGSES